MTIPKNEYPRPQMVRQDWMNLNGLWQFQFDHGRSGRERRVQDSPNLEAAILVPFCPESELSGVGYKDFIGAIWYRREFELPEEKLSGRVLLHFEAVDYFCEVWLNGRSLGTHQGGYTPFSFDITDQAAAGTNTITVYVEDDNRNPLQPRGKQAETFYSQGCDYTRVSGIWQTVWLEFVPETYIRDFRVTSDVDNAAVTLQIRTAGLLQPKDLRLEITYAGKAMAEAERKLAGTLLSVTLPLAELHLWEPLAPELYDLKLTLCNADGTSDVVTGYFGMRSVTLADKCVLINGKPVFQRLVLDQGFYREGIYTAPSDEALKRDIQISIDAGFNGARLHEKVFERRFLYWADRMGYLVWGEYGNWGLDHSNAAALIAFLKPWMDAVERDFNSPALIGWCPFNETWDYCGSRQQNKGVLSSVYYATKAMDPTRPVIDTSGNFHVVTDIFDIHDYEQDVEKFASHYAPMKEGGPSFNNFPNRQTHRGEPYFVSEYGGILWNEQQEQGWGYGNAPKTVEEFADRYVGLAKTLLENSNIFGLCYTQLYDVEQEKNGIYTYDREKKFSDSVMARLRDAMLTKAAIEE